MVFYKGCFRIFSKDIRYLNDNNKEIWVNPVALTKSYTAIYGILILKLDYGTCLG